MGESDPRRNLPLSLDNLAVNPRLARRLPPALACRYRALPVAEDSGRVTVAMAEPDDAAARQAIESALGTTCCLVRGDPLVIDALLAQVWPSEARQPLRLTICPSALDPGDELLLFAQAIGSLLGVQVNGWPTAANGGAALDTLLQAAAHYDLLILGEAEHALIERLIWPPAACQAGGQMPGALLLARGPRWPLRRILLIAQGEARDEAAVDWVVRLAGPVAAAVTVLTWLLPQSPPGSQEAPPHPGLNTLLTTDTALGQQMHRLAQKLVNWEIQSTLRLYQGWPDHQIRREVSAGDYDLIAIAAPPVTPARDVAPPGWEGRSPADELVASLLHWANRPVLIARPLVARSKQGEEPV